MKKQLTPEERLIKFFISKFNNSATNEVSISKSDLPALNLSEKEASRYIYLLQEANYLKIKHKSVHNDFSMSWHVMLEPDCVNYFNIKESIKKDKRNNWIQFWIPVSLSIIAIISSMLF